MLPNRFVNNIVYDFFWNIKKLERKQFGKYGWVTIYKYLLHHWMKLTIWILISHSSSVHLRLSTFKYGFHYPIKLDDDYNRRRNVQHMHTGTGLQYLASYFIILPNEIPRSYFNLESQIKSTSYSIQYPMPSSINT